MEREAPDAAGNGTAGAGPSGLRLQSLLQKEMRNILHREEVNEGALYLYGTGTHWVAFGKSAYQLKRRHAEAELVPFFFDTCPFPVLMASVPAGAMGVTPADGKLALEAPKLDPGAYRAWHRREMSVYGGLLRGVKGNDKG